MKALRGVFCVGMPQRCLRVPRLIFLQPHGARRALEFRIGDVPSSDLCDSRALTGDPRTPGGMNCPSVHCLCQLGQFQGCWRDVRGRGAPCPGSLLTWRHAAAAPGTVSPDPGGGFASHAPLSPPVSAVQHLWESHHCGTSLPPSRTRPTSSPALQMGEWDPLLEICSSRTLPIRTPWFYITFSTFTPMRLPAPDRPLTQKHRSPGGKMISPGDHWEWRPQLLKMWLLCVKLGGQARSQCSTDT